MLASEIFVSLTAVDDEENLFKCLHPLVVRFATTKLRPWGIPLIVLSNDSNNRYHVLESFLKTKLEKLFTEEVINKLKTEEETKKIPNALIEKYGKDNIPWFIAEVGDEPVKLEGKFEIKEKMINYYALCKSNNIFENKDLKEILKEVYDSILKIIENYKAIQKKLKPVESRILQNEDRAYNPNWLFNSLADHTLIISLSIMRLQDCLDGFFLSLNRKGNEFQIKYHPRSWQKTALNKLQKDLSRSPFDILRDDGYPPEYYQSGFAMVTGVTQVGNPLSEEIAKDHKEEIGKKYPKELHKIEEKIWCPTNYKVLYVPLNESIMNRFLIALRLPVMKKLNSFNRELLERFANKVAYRIKISFTESLLPDQNFSTLKFMLYEEAELPKPLSEEKPKNISLFNDFKRNSDAIRKIVEESGRAKELQEMTKIISHLAKNTIFNMRRIPLDRKIEELCEEGMVGWRSLSLLYKFQGDLLLSFRLIADIEKEQKLTEKKDVNLPERIVDAFAFIYNLTAALDLNRDKKWDGEGPYQWGKGEKILPLGLTLEVEENNNRKEKYEKIIPDLSIKDEISPDVKGKIESNVPELSTPLYVTLEQYQIKALEFILVESFLNVFKHKAQNCEKVIARCKSETHQNEKYIIKSIDIENKSSGPRKLKSGGIKFNKQLAKRAAFDYKTSYYDDKYTVSLSIKEEAPWL